MSLFDRRSLIAAGLGLGATAAAAAPSGPRPATASATRGAVPSVAGRLQPDAAHDQSAALQALIDEAAAAGSTLQLPPGRFIVADIKLRPGTRLTGHGAATRLVLAAGARRCLTATAADDIALESLLVDGGGTRLDDTATGLVSLADCRRLTIRDVTIDASGRDGIALQRCSGRVSDCHIRHAADAGLRSLDAAGLDIEHNVVADCANNGILVWRSKPGEDGTRVAGNRIERIAASAGGSGQNGNGINVFRASSVLVSGNRIADCAYSAVRGNAASDIAIVGNHCSRLGEVALYAEFGFEGALIASNLVDGAACGVSVTNFNEGGRLAVVQGNLIRNIVRREAEPVDKRGEAIAVEADTCVTGNTIDSAATCGISIGTGRYLRDVSATGNLIRNARVGILISADRAGGAVHVTGNMISGCSDGAIRGSQSGRAVGPDLARQPTETARVTIAGNTAV